MRLPSPRENFPKNKKKRAQHKTTRAFQQRAHVSRTCAQSRSTSRENMSRKQCGFHSSETTFPKTKNARRIKPRASFNNGRTFPERAHKAAPLRGKTCPENNAASIPPRQLSLKQKNARRIKPRALVNKGRTFPERAHKAAPLRGKTCPENNAAFSSQAAASAGSSAPCFS
ncbi:hypothetical protein TRSA_14630 [Treponema saccharophilum]|nr:hypothetical protein TRSA_14630 [Treponema saccharophilum]